MNKVGSTLTGAGTGAAIGSVAGPIGTGVGALVGGVAGYFAGSDDEGAAAAPNPASYTYSPGGHVPKYSQEDIDRDHEFVEAWAADNESRKANGDPDFPPRTYDEYAAERIAAGFPGKLSADLIQNQPDAQENGGMGPMVPATWAQAQTDKLEAERQGFRGDAAAAQGRTAAQIQFNGTGAQGYLEGADDAGRAEQLGALNRAESTNEALSAFAQQAEGPSAAQAQLRAGTDAAMRQQAALARSQPGGGGQALRGAAFNAAGLSAQASNSAAALRAQETEAYNQRKLSALDAAQAGALGVTGAAGDYRTSGQGFAETQARTAQEEGRIGVDVSKANLGAIGDQSQRNDAYALGLLGYAGQSQDQIAGLAGGQTQTQIAGDAARTGAVVNQQQLDRQDTATGLNAVSGGLTAYQSMTANSGGRGGSSPGGGYTSTGNKDPWASSDERLKEIEGREEALSAALDTVGNAPGYSYKYKDPGAPGAKPGRMMGPMAQDLERGPLGDTVVEDTPEGKMVNTSRLEMVNSSAITELNRKMEALEAALGRSAAQ
jgi:hypothetical protein